MTRTIVVDGDMLQFDPLFGNRQVTPTGPARIRGSGHATVNGRRICVEADTGPAVFKVPAQYQVPGHSPGMGIITIKSLTPNHKALQRTTQGVIVTEGGKFLAEFTPTTPAMSSSVPPQPEPGYPAPSTGTGCFLISQTLACVGN